MDPDTILPSFYADGWLAGLRLSLMELLFFGLCVLENKRRKKTPLRGIAERGAVYKVRKEPAYPMIGSPL